MSGAVARRWYLTFKTRRSYSVRPVSPGDRRLLAEFMLEVDAAATERDRASLQELSTMLFERVIVGADGAVAFAALENADGADRVIGVCAYVHAGQEGADFAIAVANSHRDEQVGRTLLETMLRQARRVGVRRLSGEMAWSNRAMHSLATSIGFQVLPSPRDRNGRLLVLELR
jgi:N-acetylglutamate synthase-like GNAT family acetyltransferase